MYGLDQHEIEYVREKYSKKYLPNRKKQWHGIAKKYIEYVRYYLSRCADDDEMERHRRPSRAENKYFVRILRITNVRWTRYREVKRNVHS